MSSQENYFRWVSQQNNNNNNNPSLRIGTSKNKNIDHWVKETCAIMSTQVAYETDHHSLFCDSICFWYFLKIKRKIILAEV